MSNILITKKLFALCCNRYNCHIMVVTAVRVFVSYKTEMASNREFLWLSKNCSFFLECLAMNEKRRWLLITHGFSLPRTLGFSSRRFCQHGVEEKLGWHRRTWHELILLSMSRQCFIRGTLLVVSILFSLFAHFPKLWLFLKRQETCFSEATFKDFQFLSVCRHIAS